MEEIEVVTVHRIETDSDAGYYYEYEQVRFVGLEQMLELWRYIDDRETAHLVSIAQVGSDGSRELVAKDFQSELVIAAVRSLASAGVVGVEWVGGEFRTDGPLPA